MTPDNVITLHRPTAQRVGGTRKKTRFTPRPRVPILAVNKERIFQEWLHHAHPEKDLARHFELRREDVELVIHEVLVERFIGEAA